jgi:hypothetical protein
MKKLSWCGSEVREERRIMQPIAEMEDDEFMKLQTLYASELPIYPICTLEDARQVLSWIVFEAPKKDMSEGVRHVLEGLLFIVTGALVSNRAEAEQEEGPTN